MAHRDLQAKETIKSLKNKIRCEDDANVRDRLRVILFALKGSTDREIGERLGYSIQWVKKWVGRYKNCGTEGLRDGLRPGAQASLNNEQVMELYAEILCGPEPGNPLSRYRIADVKKIIFDRFGVEYAISGTHALMKRMQLSHVKPRPSHPKNDPVVMEDWKKKPKNLLMNKELCGPERKFKSGSKTKHGLVKKEL